MCLYGEIHSYMKRSKFQDTEHCCYFCYIRICLGIPRRNHTNIAMVISEVCISESYYLDCLQQMCIILELKKLTLGGGF